MDRFYDGAGSIFVEAYDALYADAPQMSAFYERIAPGVGGRVLEIACGTGRVTPALANAGEVTGIDQSDGMLAVARRKASKLPGAVMKACNVDLGAKKRISPTTSTTSLRD